MAQQINLYQPEFKKEKKLISAVQVMQSCLAVAGVLLAFSGFNYWQTIQLQAKLQQAQAEQKASQTQLEEARRAFVPSEKDTKLMGQLETLTNEVNTKNQVLKVLSGKSFGNTEGFVDHFTGLARQRIDGMWLTGLSIRDGGTSLGMKGASLRPEYVPRYLQRLASEAAFVGTEFKTFLMARSEKQKQWVNFDLQSVIQADKK